MTVIRFMFSVAVGGLITWMIQTSGLMRWVWLRNELTAELGRCDLCLGFWVFLALGGAVNDRPQLCESKAEPFIYAFVASFLSHVFRLGLKAKFGRVVI